MVFRNMRTLLSGDLGEIADALTGVLHDLATIVRDSA